MQVRCAAHWLPHAPQFALSSVMCASHPLPGAPSQSVKPGLHVV
ncbi:MAG: hypothetical protein ABI867_15420 [Kofleriaceae bacterium]